MHLVLFLFFLAVPAGRLAYMRKYLTGELYMPLPVDSMDRQRRSLIRPSDARSGNDKKTLTIRWVEHRTGRLVLKSYVVFDPSIVSISNPRPAVLVIHDWNGRDAFENGKAEEIAKLGYVAYAVDLFGQVGNSPYHNDRLINPFRKDRSLLLKRLQLAWDELHKLPYVDKDSLAAVGFSFGALGALDMARAEWSLRGVVSFHGTLGAPKLSSMYSDTSNISARILVLHGYGDRSVPLAGVREFQLEMTKRKADWRVHLYGDAVGDFTRPSAKVPGRLMYNAQADKRSWQAMNRFLKEIFGENDN